MKINHSTPLHAIAERMGDCATNDDAAAMRSILVQSGHKDTDEITEADWLRYLDMAVNRSGLLVTVDGKPTRFDGWLHLTDRDVQERCCDALNAAGTYSPQALVDAYEAAMATARDEDADTA